MAVFTEDDMGRTERRVGDLLNEMFSLTGDKFGYHDRLVQEWEFLDETLASLTGDSPFRSPLVDCAYRVCDAWMSVVGIPLIIKEEDSQRDLRNTMDELERCKVENEELELDLESIKAECEDLRTRLEFATEAEQRLSKEYAALQDAYSQSQTTIEILSTEGTPLAPPSGDTTAEPSELTSENNTPVPGDDAVELENELSELRLRFASEVDRHTQDVIDLEKRNASLEKTLEKNNIVLERTKEDLKAAKETITGQRRFIDQLEKDMGALALATENPDHDAAPVYQHGREATQRIDTRLVSAQSSHFGGESIGLYSVARALASAEIDDATLSPESAGMQSQPLHISPKLFSEPSNTGYYESTIAGTTSKHGRQYSLVRAGSAIGSVVLFSDITVDVSTSPRTALALKTSTSTDSESEDASSDMVSSRPRTGTVQMDEDMDEHDVEDEDLKDGKKETKSGGFDDIPTMQSDSTVLVSEDVDIGYDSPRPESEAEGEPSAVIAAERVEKADDEDEDGEEGDEQPLLGGVKRTGTGVAAADNDDQSDFCSVAGCRGLFGW